MKNHPVTSSPASQKRAGRDPGASILAKRPVKRATGSHLVVSHVFSRRAGIVVSGCFQSGLEPVFRKLKDFGRPVFPFLILLLLLGCAEHPLPYDPTRPDATPLKCPRGACQNLLQ
jgi:hypothetical protein